MQQPQNEILRYLSQAQRCLDRGRRLNVERLRRSSSGILIWCGNGTRDSATRAIRCTSVPVRAVACSPRLASNPMDIADVHQHPPHLMRWRLRLNTFTVNILCKHLLSRRLRILRTAITNLVVTLFACARLRGLQWHARSSRYGLRCGSRSRVAESFESRGAGR